MMDGNGGVIMNETASNIDMIGFNMAQAQAHAHGHMHNNPNGINGGNQHHINGINGNINGMTMDGNNSIVSGEINGNMMNIDPNTVNNINNINMGNMNNFEIDMNSINTINNNNLNFVTQQNISNISNISTLFGTQFGEMPALDAVQSVPPPSAHNNNNNLQQQQHQMLQHQHRDAQLSADLQRQNIG